MIRKIFNTLPAWLRKLFPAIVLIGLVVIACSTDLLSAQVQQFTLTALKQHASDFTPIVLDLFIAAVCLNVAWLLHSSFKKLVNRLLERTGSSARGKLLIARAIDVAYWGTAIFAVASMFASGLVGKLLLGLSLLGAALTLAMQGVANDIISGILMQVTQRVRIGDDIKVIGLEVEGKIQDVGYVSTTIASSADVFTVPNRKIWESALKVRSSVSRANSLLPDESGQPDTDDSQNNE